MEILIRLTIVFLLSQLIVTIIMFLLDDDNDLFESKREFLLWLIPVYMPIRKLIELIINKWNELEPKKEVPNYIEGCVNVPGITRQCPKCKSGKMEFETMLLSNPPQHQYKCTECDYVESITPSKLK